MRFVARYVCLSSLLTSVVWIIFIFLYWKIPTGDEKIQFSKFVEKLVQADQSGNFNIAGKCPVFQKRYTSNVVNESDLGKLSIVYKPEDQKGKDIGYKRYGFNELVSERLGYYRAIPDFRHEFCHNKVYSKDLPSTSVIICFYNEAWSVLLRTVFSVINRSPPGVICEILLIDDSSDLLHLGEELNNFIAANLTPIVRLYRTSRREGLIRARIFGADHATSDVLVFLDSHCEVNVGWLEPLLSHIKLDRRNVAIPVIDMINQDSLAYEASPLVRGGFNWGMFYRWDHIAQPLSKDEAIQPIKTPTMAGGLFAIERHYFNELGKYDAALDTWGGENLELSFRVWQCGGRMDIIPCSRVGHIFRNRRPYGNIGGTDSLTQNSLRVVHVWLDEYKEYYFQLRPDARNMTYGDISERLALRKRLNCKSFKWYLENVYPEQTLPDKQNPVVGGVPKGFYHGLIKQKKLDFKRKGRLQHSQSHLCVVADGNIYDKKSLVKLSRCSDIDSNQLWYEYEQHSLQLAGVLCLEFEDVHVGRSYAHLAKCHFAGGGQEWKWLNNSRDGHSSLLLNPASGKCLSSTSTGPESYLTLDICDSLNALQHFVFSK